MRQTILSTLVSALIAASTMQTAVAAERHHAKQADGAAASERLRNANNFVPPSATSFWTYSGYSAPAGH